MTHEHLRVNILVDEQSTYLFIGLFMKSSAARISWILSVYRVGKDCLTLWIRLKRKDMKGMWNGDLGN